MRDWLKKNPAIAFGITTVLSTAALYFSGEIEFPQMLTMIVAILIPSPVRKVAK